MKKIFLVVILGFLAFFVFSLWWKQGLLPSNPQDKSYKIFVIKKGEGVRTIANELKKQGLIKDPVVFFLLVKKLGLDGKIQAGDFRLSPSQRAQEIAENLTHGTLDVWVTIPEGLRAQEIADVLKTKIQTFDESWREKLQINEGYLFPDTYLVPKDADIDLIIKLMKDNFDEKFASIQKTKNKLSKNEIVIIASMIEREAKLSADRPLVASVILNRLSIGMPLQIDATIQYALGYQWNQKTWWKKNLTKEDLKLDSPYNTYENIGLPPSPISNPGFDVLEAATNPKETEYLYYVSDSSGRNHYARTLEGHNTNIKKFRP